MRVNRPSLCITCIAVAVSLFYSTEKAAANEYLINGDFTNGLHGWYNTGWSFDGGSSGVPHTDGLSIVDSAPYTNSIMLTGESGRNYNVRMEQTLSAAPFSSGFELSFDWKVPSKETPWGVNYVMVEFNDAGANPIGRAIWYNTSNPSYDNNYFQQTRPSDMFYGMHKYRQTFDWEHILIDDSFLPGMDLSQVNDIRFILDVQNDAGSGGSMLVDNIRLVIPEPGSLLVLALGTVFCLNRRKKALCKND